MNNILENYIWSAKFFLPEGYDEAAAELAQLHADLETTKKDLADSSAQLELDNEECIQLRADLQNTQELVALCTNAEEIAQLRAENAEMREALQPFANKAPQMTIFSNENFYESKLGISREEWHRAIEVFAKYPKDTK